MCQLMLSELSLSDQVAIELKVAAKLQAKAEALITFLDSPVKTALTPLGASTSLDTGESDSFPAAEIAAMLESSCQFFPIRPCSCGRHARIYEARGNCTVRYFAECAACQLRTGRVTLMSDAADEWNAGSAAPIHYHSAEAVAA